MINRVNSSAIQNYRKHSETAWFLEQTGVIVYLTRLTNMNDSLHYSGIVGMIKLDNDTSMVLPIHSASIKTAKVGDKVVLTLGLESKNKEGLRNYGLVAKVCNEN
jgi:uncharacterized OB-fold protein